MSFSSSTPLRHHLSSDINCNHEFIHAYLRSKAAEFYRQGGEYSKLVRCLFLLEDYPALEGIIAELPEGHALLSELSRIFCSIGCAQVAASALVKVRFPDHSQ